MFIGFNSVWTNDWQKMKWQVWSITLLLQWSRWKGSHGWYQVLTWHLSVVPPEHQLIILRRSRSAINACHHSHRAVKTTYIYKRLSKNLRWRHKKKKTTGVLSNRKRPGWEKPLYNRGLTEVKKVGVSSKYMINGCLHGGTFKNKKVRLDSNVVEIYPIPPILAFDH